MLARDQCEERDQTESVCLDCSGPATVAEFLGEEGKLQIMPLGLVDCMEAIEERHRGLSRIRIRTEISISKNADHASLNRLCPQAIGQIPPCTRSSQPSLVMNNDRFRDRNHEGRKPFVLDPFRYHAA